MPSITRTITIAVMLVALSAGTAFTTPVDRDAPSALQAALVARDVPFAGELATPIKRELEDSTPALHARSPKST